MCAEALYKGNAHTGFAKLRAFPQRTPLRRQGSPVVGLQMGGKPMRQYFAVGRSNCRRNGRGCAECPRARQAANPFGLDR